MSLPRPPPVNSAFQAPAPKPPWRLQTSCSCATACATYGPQSTSAAPRSSASELISCGHSDTILSVCPLQLAALCLWASSCLRGRQVSLTCPLFYLMPAVTRHAGLAMALSSVSVVVSSLLLNLYTPPGAPAWHQNVLRQVQNALKSRWFLRGFRQVRLVQRPWPCKRGASD